MSSMHKKSMIATAAIFCCRFTGLLREVVYTSLFGATGALDAFLTAFRVPNMLRDMFAEGALSQSFTSVMSKVENKDGKEAAWTLANRVASQLTSLMLVIVSAGILLAGVFMQALYPENARVVVEQGAVSATTFCELRADADGMKEAVFVSPEVPTWIHSQSCIKLSTAEKLTPGSEYQLKEHAVSRKEMQANTLVVAPRGYIELATDLCRIIWPFILLASLSALCMGALNVFGIFGLPNLSSAAFNLTTVGVGVLVGWFIDPSFGPNALYGFAVAIVCGGLAQVVVQLPKLRQMGFRPRWDIGLIRTKTWFAFRDESARKVWMLMLPGVIAAGITQTNIFINTMFALYLQPGSVTALSSAFHLWQLPVALFGVAMGMVVLPSVSRMTLTSGGGGNDIAEHLAKALRFMALFAVPSAIFLFLWGEQIVSVFFQRGRFDEAASELTGSVLGAFSLGLLSYAGMKVLQPVFLALEKPWAPAFLALFAAAVSVTLNYLFVRVFFMPVQYLALTTSVVTTLNFLFYFLYLRHLLGTMALRRVLLPGLVRIAAAGALLAASCFAVRCFLFGGFTSWGFAARFGAMALGGIIGACIYGIACMLFRVPEISILTNRFLRRRRTGAQ